jgi:hypothetical protein
VKFVDLFSTFGVDGGWANSLYVKTNLLRNVKQEHRNEPSVSIKDEGFLD